MRVLKIPKSCSDPEASSAQATKGLARLKLVLCAGDSPQPLKIAHFPHFTLKQKEREGFILWL